MQFQFSEPTAHFGLKGKRTHQTVCITKLFSHDMLADWVKKHKAKTPGNRALQHQLDEWMEQWEASEKELHESATAAAADEGWTVVTKHRVGLPAVCVYMLANPNMLRHYSHHVLHRAERRALTRVAHQLALLRQLLQLLHSQERLQSN